jgi:hypothetical protein
MMKLALSKLYSHRLFDHKKNFKQMKRAMCNLYSQRGMIISGEFHVAT